MPMITRSQTRNQERIKKQNQKFNFYHQQRAKVIACKNTQSSPTKVDRESEEFKIKVNELSKILKKSVSIIEVRRNQDPLPIKSIVEDNVMPIYEAVCRMPELLAFTDFRKVIVERRNYFLNLYMENNCGDLRDTAMGERFVNLVMDYMKYEIEDPYCFDYYRLKQLNRLVITID